MCRMLVYAGKLVLLRNFLYEPSNSIIQQTVLPKQLGLLNIAGIGLLFWPELNQNTNQPITYKETKLAMHDENLRSIASSIKVKALLAHIRGITDSLSSSYDLANLHPFKFDNYDIALAHNGEIAGFDKIKIKLIQYIKPELFSKISGCTDSEWIYALFLSQLTGSAPSLNQFKTCTLRTLDILRKVLSSENISHQSSINLIITNGKYYVATRYAINDGFWNSSRSSINGIPRQPTSLWYTIGSEYGYFNGEWRMLHKKGITDSIIISSEPLTTDMTTWLPIPEYSMLAFEVKNGIKNFSVEPIYHE